MGMTPVGSLIYGYALGGSEGGWLIKEIDEDGNWLVPWAPTEQQDEAFPDLDEIVKDRVLADVLGFTEPDPHPKAWRKHGPDSPEFDAHFSWLAARTAAFNAQPIRHIHHGYEFSENALVTFQAEAEWGEVVPVDVAALEARRVAEGWDDALAQLITLLGITPITLEGTDRWDDNAPRVPVPPRWMVVAQYS